MPVSRRPSRRCDRPVVVLVIYVRALGRGQTWGMRITKIRLVRSDNGMPVGFGKALGRTLFADIVSANVFYLGYLWAAWDDRKQTWQDKIVSSYVVRDASSKLCRWRSPRSPTISSCCTKAPVPTGSPGWRRARTPPFDFPVRTLDRPNGALFGRLATVNDVHFGEIEARPDRDDLV